MTEPYVFGLRPVMEAILAGREIEKCLIRKGLQGELYRELFALIRERGIPFQFVPMERINRISRKNHQGVLAYLSPIEYQKLEVLIPSLYESGKVPFMLLLDEVTDVRNLGAIARTAESAGVHALVVPSRGSALLTADAVKTSAGALFSLPVCRVNSLADTAVFLKNSGVQVYGASEQADRLYTDPDYSLPTALVMGSEEHGINPAMIGRLDGLVRIPMAGKIASMNVSVSAGILLYEVVRQRIMAGPQADRG